MNIEFYPVDKLKKEVVQIVGKYLDIASYHLFFFGSRVKGTNFARADIDIGIEGLQEISAQIKLDIEEELNNLPMLYKIDFVDFNQVSESFKTEALKYKEMIKL